MGSEQGILSLSENTAICLIKSDRLDEAVRILESADTDIGPVSAYLLVVIYVKRMNYEKAAMAFQKIPSESPYHAVSRSLLRASEEGTDDPYTSLNVGQREKGTAIWEDALRSNANDLKIWHNLAVLHYWQAKHLEENKGPREAVPHWRKAIGYWAGVLASDDFWRNFAGLRAPVYGFQESDISRINMGFATHLESKPLREDELDPYIGDLIKLCNDIEGQLCTHFSGMSNGDDDKEEGPYAQLLQEFVLELNTARQIEIAKRMCRIAEHVDRLDLRQDMAKKLVEFAGHIGSQRQGGVGIALNLMELGMRIEGDITTEIPSCGPIMLDFLGLTEEARKLVDTILRMKAPQPIDALQRLIEPSLAKLEFYLDPDLGRLTAMVYMRKFDSAIQRASDKLKPGSDEIESSQMENFRSILAAACHGKANILTEDEPKMRQEILGALLFSAEAQYQSNLNSGVISEGLRQGFKNNSKSLSCNVSVSVEGKDVRWLITDEDNMYIYIVKKQEGRLDIYSGAYEYRAAISALKIANLYASFRTNQRPFIFNIPELMMDIRAKILKSVDCEEITVNEGIELVELLLPIAPAGSFDIYDRTIQELKDWG